MEYQTKSIIVDRKKDKEHPDKEMPYNVEIKFFGLNNPHMTDEVPVKNLEFENIHRVIIKGFEVNFLPRGADILLNDVDKVDVEHDPHGHVIITKI
ncbi:hypothetical protein KY328_02255 [Candidatus Woesearchaeota archaeon]|nr:hypothetical protein [Candidatus Woesearchaeota archaeon]MBW3021715.1 hypothetical protein [Candidatus Woesearchaeota archaeon]